MAEKKAIITPIAKVANANLMQDLTVISVGNDQVSRIGTKIMMTSVEIRVTTIPPVATTAFFNVSFVCVLFSWNSDTAPVPETLFDPLYLTTTVQRQTLLPFNNEHKASRKVLWTKRWSAVYYYDIATSHYVTITPNTVRVFDICIPLVKMRGGRNIVEFDPAATTGRNKLYLYVGSSDNGAAAGQGSIMTGVVRVNFVDM